LVEVFLVTVPAVVLFVFHAVVVFRLDNPSGLKDQTVLVILVVATSVLEVVFVFQKVDHSVEKLVVTSVFLDPP
tara:strand:- start:1257 stop:1478 length:222 start_codon:yes stop_codon:yes gene_type:complete